LRFQVESLSEVIGPVLYRKPAAGSGAAVLKANW
jgi:hypothetical protein